MPAANFYGKRKKPAEQNSADAAPKRVVGKPFQPGQSGNPRGKLKGTLNRATVEVRDFWAREIDDPEYQAELRGRLRRGELAPAVECMGWHYAKGKPTERIEMVVSQARLEELAKQEPERFTTLGEQVRAAVAFLEEVNKP